MTSLRSLPPLFTRTTLRKSAFTRTIPLSTVRSPFQRNYATTPTQATQGSNPLLWIGCLSLGVAYTYYEKKQKEKAAISESKEEPEAQSKEESKNHKENTQKDISAEKSKVIDYQKVYNDIAELLDADTDYDDGSYGPILLRLAWHSSGTFDKESSTGGSTAGSMRFKTEASHAANNGLQVARDLLKEKIQSKYPEISHGDLYTLGGVVAVQELGGPDIKWRPGRKDGDEKKCTPDGRLPDGAKKQNHAREVFGRMGFNDRELVALVGAHALGRCHLDRSGFEGPWHEAPTMFSNGYFKSITSREWEKKDLGNGQWQWVDKSDPNIMMLPIEICMMNDEKLKLYYELYTKDMDAFYKDFAGAFKKLLELGVQFNGDEKEYIFKRVNED